MNRSIVALLFAGLSLYSAAALAAPEGQKFDDDNRVSNIYLGFQIGYVDSSTGAVDYPYTFGHLGGFEVGVQAEFSLLPWFSIQPEARYIQKGFSSFDPESGSSENIRLDYIEIPVLAKFKLPTRTFFSPFVYAGPYVAFKIGERGSLDQGNEDQNPVPYFGIDPSQLNSVDAGVQLGIGADFQIAPTTKAFIVFERDASLTDLDPDLFVPGGNVVLTGISVGL